MKNMLLVLRKTHTFFVLLMEHGRHIFAIDLTPALEVPFFGVCVCVWLNQPYWRQSESELSLLGAVVGIC